MRHGSTPLLLLALVVGSTAPAFAQADDDAPTSVGEAAPTSVAEEIPTSVDSQGSGGFEVDGRTVMPFDPDFSPVMPYEFFPYVYGLEPAPDSGYYEEPTEMRGGGIGGVPPVKVEDDDVL